MMKSKLICLMLTVAVLLSTGCAKQQKITEVEIPYEDKDVKEVHKDEAVKPPVVMSTPELQIEVPSEPENVPSEAAPPEKPSAGETAPKETPAVKKNANEKNVMGRIKSLDGTKLTLEIAEMGDNKAPNGEKPSFPTGEMPQGGEAPEMPANAGTGTPPDAPEMPKDGSGAPQGLSLSDIKYSGETKEYTLSANVSIDGADTLKADMVVTLEFNEDGSVKRAKVIGE